MLPVDERLTVDPPVGDALQVIEVPEGRDVVPRLQFIPLRVPLPLPVVLAVNVKFVVAGLETNVVTLCAARVAVNAPLEIGMVV